MKNKEEPDAYRQERTYSLNLPIPSASRNGGENLSAELDGCTVRLRRVVA